MPPGRLDMPVEKLPGIGPATGRALRRRGVATAGDLLAVLPRAYEDLRRVSPIAELRPGERQVAVGVVATRQLVGPPRRRRLEVVLHPEGRGPGRPLRLVWFHARPSQGERFRPGERVRAAGTVSVHRGELTMAHPDADPVNEAAGGLGIVPRYPELGGVASRVLERASRTALSMVADGIPERVPAAVLSSLGLPTLAEALRAIHAPPADLPAEEVARLDDRDSLAHRRLAFEELFLLELELSRRRVAERGLWAEALAPGDAVARAERALPFTLTGAQRRAVAEITADLALDRPMRRLLQGDVGSGKTAVALLAAAHAVGAGAQVALMAPTELLAEQHHRALARLAPELGLQIELVTAGLGAEARRAAEAAVASGRAGIVVGTHALLSEGVRFPRLRLCIVDEQHRFGVAQRLRLAGKTDGVAPHLLVMTATPIPRSLALVLYGDLEATVVDELPPGRIPPVTRMLPEKARAQAHRQLERALEAGGRAYVVCPAVEGDEELRGVDEVAAELRTRFGEGEVGVMHGRLPPAERTGVMGRFARGELRILCATTVVEVGVDVPEANAILIEQAERFGLAQLHQLRGRVGRGGQRSACLLLHRTEEEAALERLRVLCETSDGFRIAEEDLRLRGPGEIFGRRQSGLGGTLGGDLRKWLPLLEKAREAASGLLAADPELARPEHALLRDALDALAATEVVKEEAG